MKTFLTFFIFFFSFSGVAEIYTCSHELSRFDRPGEVETKIFTREGEYFYHNFGWKYEVIRDTNNMLIIVFVVNLAMMSPLFTFALKLIGSNNSFFFIL